MEIILEEEQKQTLIMLVEATRSQPRTARQPFRAMRIDDRLLLPSYPGLPRAVTLYPGDIEELANQGLLRLPKRDHTWQFEVSPLGFHHYAQLKGQEGEGATRIEASLRSYLDASAFAQRHPAAWKKWHAAEEKVWSEDSAQADTTIGHLCREAHQEFADSFLALHPTQDAPADKTATKSRIQAVLRSLPKQSATVLTAVSALVDLWSAVIDLAQRQEHAGHKEGQLLTWEDSRRLVFQTLFIMTELDRWITQ